MSQRLDEIIILAHRTRPLRLYNGKERSFLNKSESKMSKIIHLSSYLFTYLKPQFQNLQKTFRNIVKKDNCWLGLQYYPQLKYIYLRNSYAPFPHICKYML